jgi:hypothetical protein
MDLATSECGLVMNYFTLLWPCMTQNWRVVRLPEMGWVGGPQPETNS